MDIKEARRLMNEYQTGINHCNRILQDNNNSEREHFKKVLPKYQAGFEKMKKIVEKLEKEIV